MGKKPKIKHDTLSNDYENGGLKSADIFSKIVISYAFGSKDYMMKTFIPGR